MTTNFNIALDQLQEIHKIQGMRDSLPPLEATMTEQRVELSVAQIAKRHGVTPRTIWNWYEKGLLPTGRRKGLRKDLYIPLDELIEAEEEHGLEPIPEDDIDESLT